MGFFHLAFSVDTINVETDYREIDQAFPDHLYSPDDPILFMNRQESDMDSLKNYGLHFKNHVLTNVPNDIILRTESDTTCTSFDACEEPQWYDSPIIGVHGQGTHVVCQGRMKVDNSRADLFLALTDSGRFTLDSLAYVDLVFSRWGNFTRSIYVYSDGTGTFEIAGGFVSDRSNYGERPVGMGAVRLYDAIFVSHDSEGLPYYYRPQRSDTHPKINSHLVVLKDAAQSQWKVQTKNQDFPGGLWIYEDFLIETETDLEISGQIDTFKYSEDYVNYGGLMIFEKHKTVTKTGPANLILSGDQAYAEGAAIVVNQGGLVLATDPFMYEDTHFTKFKNFQTGQHLSVILNEGSEFEARAEDVHLQSLHINGEDVSVIILHGSVLTSDTTILNGNLIVDIPNEVELQSGDILKIADFQNISGKFISVQDKKNRYIWDTTDLYSDGTLKVTGVITDVVMQNEKIFTQTAYPNPSTGDVTIFIPYNAKHLNIFSSQGVFYRSFDIASYTEDSFTLSLEHTGLYAFYILSNEALLSKGKILIVK